MGILNKFFKNKRKKKQTNDQNNSKTKNGFQKDNEPDENTNDYGVGLSLSISSDDECYGISISSSSVGDTTGNMAADFYVYDWFIEETGEIFYVGKGRGNRYKTYHERAYEAEKIREKYRTSYRFVGHGLTEEQAVELESKEMTRILDETDDRLTNRVIPLLTKRDNGYGYSPDTPELQFETAPHLYASEIENHYFGVKCRPFDEVKPENLKTVTFITRNIRDEVQVIYGDKLNDYQDETRALLLTNGTRILKSKFAKTITAWIYIGDDYVTNYENDQKQALDKLGRHIPTYHLIDVWKFLKDKFSEVSISTGKDVPINPIHNRVPLKDARNLNDWRKGFDEGSPYWERGDRERKDGNLKKAIELFDAARYNGYEAPALYRSYAMAYRKLKDYDNEIAIIDEAIERLEAAEINISEIHIMNLKERRLKALALKEKQNGQR